MGWKERLTRLERRMCSIESRVGSPSCFTETVAVRLEWLEKLAKKSKSQEPFTPLPGGVAASHYRCVKCQELGHLSDMLAVEVGEWPSYFHKKCYVEHLASDDKEDK